MRRHPYIGCSPISSRHTSFWLVFPLPKLFCCNKRCIVHYGSASHIRREKVALEIMKAADYDVEVSAVLSIYFLSRT